jgi:predicted DNA-binding transcriptional regulator AlpA
MESYRNTKNGSDDARLLTEHEVANLLALSIKTLRNWRLSGSGPCHLKVGRLVRYRLSDVRAWLGNARAQIRRTMRTNGIGGRPNGPGNSFR